MRQVACEDRRGETTRVAVLSTESWILTLRLTVDSLLTRHRLAAARRNVKRLSWNKMSSALDVRYTGCISDLYDDGSDVPD